MNPLHGLLILVDRATATYISGTVANLVGVIDPVFRKLLMIFFILYGLAMWRGAVKADLAEFVTKLIKASIVYAMIYNWSIYNQFIVDFLTNGPDALAAAIAGVPQASITNTIDETQFACFDAMMAAFRGDGWAMKYIIGGLIFLSSTIVVAYAGFLLVVPKIALSILIAIGPLAFTMLLFEGTKRMFDSWLQQCLNFFLYTVLTIMVLTLLGAIFAAAVRVIPTTSDSITFGTIVPLVFVCVVIWLVLKQVPGIASGIAGGVQVTTLGAEGGPGSAMGNIFNRWARGRRFGWPKRSNRNVVNGR